MSTPTVYIDADGRYTVGNPFAAPARSAAYRRGCRAGVRAVRSGGVPLTVAGDAGRRATRARYGSDAREYWTGYRAGALAA